MPIFHRKLLSHEKCDDCYSPPAPPSPNQLSPFLIFVFCAVAALFAFIFYFILSTRHRRRMTNNNNPRTNLDETRQDFVVEEQGPMVDHPIWLIRTVGLEQSLIDSIEVFKYKKSDRLIDGTECSVCLNEFQDDESLRLLPKCSHAFHIPCIDTWLRSHKNCPLCRAPIVRSNAPERAVDSISPNGPSSSSEVSSENGEGSVEDGEEQGETIGEPGLGSNPIRVRVKSDLADYRGNDGGELQPVRRSVSMDASSASMIYLAVANMPVMEEEEAQEPNNRLVGMKTPNPAKSTKDHKRSSSSIYDRVMKSSSRRFSISMKRSYSCSSNGKSSLQPL